MDNERRLSPFRENILNFGSFSTYRNAMYGLAVMWIVLFHGVLMYNVRAEVRPVLPFVCDTLIMGNIGVDVFIFLSGICLYFSYSKGPKTGSFYYKRMVRVYIPYLLMTLPFIIQVFVIGQIDLPVFIQAIFTVNFWTGETTPIDFWYVSTILVFYLLYPLIYRFIFHKSPAPKRAVPNGSQDRNEFLRMLLLAGLSIALSLVIYYCFSDVYLIVDRALSRLTVFIIGTYVGKLVKEKKRFHIAFLIAAVLIVIGSYPLYAGQLLDGVWFRYYGSLTGIALVFVYSQMFLFLSYIKLDKVFAFFGTFSLEIYIMTVLGNKIFVTTDWYADHAAIHHLLAMAIAIFAAWLVSCIEKPIFKLLLRSNSKKKSHSEH